MHTSDDKLLQFPCDFPVKAMGRGIIGLEDTIVAIIRRHAESDDINSVKTRPSRNDNYISVTVRITARSRGQLDDIYRDLTDHPDVLMAL